MEQQTQKTIQVDIVSAEKEIYSGTAQYLVAMTESGEVGIKPGHTPLLALLKPGEVMLLQTDNTELSFYVSTGTMEVQSHQVILLADTVQRVDELDELAALQAKQRAEEKLKQKNGDIDFDKAHIELAEAAAQLRLLKKLKDLR